MDNIFKQKNSNFFIDGDKCKTKEDMFNEFSNVFDFPDYFTNNWDSFEEIMTDLSWIKYDKIKIILYHSASLMQNDTSNEKVLMETLHTINENSEKRMVWIRD